VKDKAWRTRSLQGFTLIELLVVLAIIALLLTLATPRYLRSLDKAQETVLEESLRQMRETIDHFYRDTGEYPESLEELVARRYLRSVPVDPVTESNRTWILIAPAAGSRGKVYNLRSGADGVAPSGKRYSEM
jgi:general secretion pathway protein G